MRKFIFCLMLLIMVSLSVVLNTAADMGAIVPVADVTVEEPGQKAIIAHDGFEEILILATDLKASRDTKVLRFIPLPAEPIVTAAPDDCFPNLGKLLKSHNIKYLIFYRGKGAETAEAVELRFHKKIGAHDVTVVHVKDAAHFSTWANDFFKEKGLPQRKLSDKEAAIVSDYVKRGFPFFVFDLVEIGPKTESIQPLVYQFPCRNLYYPLKATNLFGGEGTIELFVFCDRGEIHNLLFASYKDTKVRLTWQTSSTAIVTKQEIKTVSLKIADLLGKNALLRVFKYHGKLDFEGDIWRYIRAYEVGPRGPMKFE